MSAVTRLLFCSFILLIQVFGSQCDDSSDEDDRSYNTDSIRNDVGVSTNVETDVLSYCADVDNYYNTAADLYARNEITSAELIQRLRSVKTNMDTLYQRTQTLATVSVQQYSVTSSYRSVQQQMSSARTRISQVLNEWEIRANRRSESAEKRLRFLQNDVYPAFNVLNQACTEVTSIIERRSTGTAGSRRRSSRSRGGDSDSDSDED